MIESTRSRVIEKSVELEELISLLLSNLLDIEKENSISFGTTSFALSFNSKINLLHDLNFLPSELKKNLVLFAEIRNKFAHVLSVDSFTMCFEIISKNSKNSKAKKNQLLKKRNEKKQDNDGISEDEEAVLNACFDLLCLEIGLLIQLSSQLIHNRKIADLNKTHVIEIIRKFIIEAENNSIDKLIEIIKPQIEEILPHEEWVSVYQELKINK